MLNSKWLKDTLLVWLVIFTVCLVTPSMAAENGPINYIAGASGVFIGEFPPIPGLFVVSQTSHITSNALYDGNGDKIAEDDFDFSVWAQTFRFVASYPKQLWGANLYSQLVVPIVNVDNSLTVNTAQGSLDIFDDSDTGLGNLTLSPLILNWQKKASHQYFTLGLDIALEAGASYEKDRQVNAGTGYTSIIPVLAYRYDNPNGLDVGIKAHPMFNLKNDYTHYDSGDMLIAEFTAGWNFDNWKPGIVGGYTHQYEADEDNGTKVDDSELRSLNIGPSITYSKGPLIVNLNYQKSVIAENTSMNDAFWLNFTLPLYVPPSARY